MDGGQERRKDFKQRRWSWETDWKPPKWQSIVLFSGDDTYLGPVFVVRYDNTPKPPQLHPYSFPLTPENIKVVDYIS